MQEGLASRKKRCEAEGFGCGPKQVRVRAEHENELTVLSNANEPFESTKQERDIEREREGSG
jgi:hypothetical protein